MSIIKAFKLRCQRVHYGIDTRREFLLQYVDRASAKFTGMKTSFYHTAHIKRLADTFRAGDIYNINGAKLPLMNEVDNDFFLWGYVYEDTFGAYVYFNDDYSEGTVDLCDELFIEGAYGLVNDKVNVTVKPEDIVIDAGSWVGDFAAYASAKGAQVYAFEPTESTFAILKQTARLNGNITPINLGLSDENTKLSLFENHAGNTSANSLMNKKGNKSYEEAAAQVQTIRLDVFVREYNLPHVDFIKADIEGFERHMLAGAQETLARFAPKLSLCTYHLPDDPEVMAELILKANPKYNIVQKRMKLFASVPK